MGFYLAEFDQEVYKKNVYQDGYNAGVVEGREAGREEGREEGVRDTKIAAARNLLQMNLGTPEQIAKAANIPVEEVLALQKEIQ